MAKFPLSKYASLEMNRAAYLKNGLVRSQTPLSDEFTAAAPCENGMWVDANIANQEIKLPTADTVQYGIVYTTEKEWGRYVYGLKEHFDVAGAYPRVGILHSGDIFTTNCFDMGDFADLKAFEEAIDKSFAGELSEMRDELESFYAGHLSALEGAIAPAELIAIRSRL